jgi:hypothetical protein
MKTTARGLGVLAIFIGLLAAGTGCDRQTVMVVRAAGVSGSVTTNMTFAEAKKLVVAAGGVDAPMDPAKPVPGIDQRIRLRNGGELWFSVNKTNDTITDVRYWKYRDMSPIKLHLKEFRIEDSTKAKP